MARQGLGDRAGGFPAVVAVAVGLGMMLAACQGTAPGSPTAAQGATPETKGTASPAMATAAPAGAGGTSMALELTSTAFGAGQDIPREYTCDGQNKSPELTWSGVPAGTTSFALIVDDPDAPRGTFVHWVLFNLRGTARQLPAGVAAEATLPDGARQGSNSAGKTGYAGPCPPSGPAHRYFFHLYALDGTLNLPAGATKQDVLAAMQGHVLAESEIMGRYARKS